MTTLKPPSPGKTPPPEGLPLRLSRPADLVAAVPYLLGFHPSDSLVVLALRGRRLVFNVRVDLPPADRSPTESRDLASYLRDVVVRQDVTSAVLIGYGPDERVRPLLNAVEAPLIQAGLAVLDELRVTDGRYWSYLCDQPRCCPPEGTPVDLTASPVAAAATVAGLVALPGREALADQVKPVDGLARQAMTQATGRAMDRLNELVCKADGRTGALLAVHDAGSAAVRQAVARQRAGDRLDDDGVAWLTVLLCDVAVRDMAWSAIDEGLSESDLHRRLWTDVTRRAEPDLAAPPATLLAFTAWRSGDGATAAVALDRALHADPGYSLALLVADLLSKGVPPASIPPVSRLGHARVRPPRGRRLNRRSSKRRAGSRPG